MLEFQKKKRTRRMMYSPIVLLSLAIILVLLLRGVWGVYKKDSLSYQNLEKEKTELNKLELRKKNLASSLDYLKTDQGVESEIRSKFRAVKDGEQVAVIIDDQPTTTPVSTTPKASFWSRLFH